MPNLPFDHRRALEIGSAGEYLVCADLLLHGYRAFLAAQGSLYDLIVDVDGTLFRVAVKSTMSARPRPGRPGSRGIYMFSVGRPRRDHKGVTTQRAYTCDQVDLVAMVALDTKEIAYVALKACATMMHFEADGIGRTTKFGPKTKPIRKMEDFSFEHALGAFYAEG